MMKLIAAALILLTFLSVQAKQLVKLTGQPDELSVQNLTANADGSISYTFKGKRWNAPRYSFDYARVSKPRTIEAADKVLKSGDFAKAEKLFQIEYESYKDLGWGIYCITGRAKALMRLGKRKEALKQLEVLKTYSSVDPHLTKDIIEAKLVYLDLLIKIKAFVTASILAESLLSSDDNSVVFLALERKGDIAYFQKDKKKAVRDYLQACFLILDHPRRPEVLYKATIILKGMNDKRWSRFASILKKQYPDSEFAKKLRQ